MTDSETAKCLTCGKALDDPLDPDSVDCGGDCYGCIQDAENIVSDAAAEMGVSEYYEMTGKLPGDN